MNNQGNGKCPIFHGGSTTKDSSIDKWWPKSLNLDILFKNLKGKRAILLCDDYGEESFIPEVKKAIDDFANINNLKINLIENRFAEITT